MESPDRVAFEAQNRPGPLGALRHALGASLRGWREERALGTTLDSAGVGTAERVRILDLTRRERRLRLQLNVLPSFQRLLRYWHAFHVPLTALMFAVLAVHVGVAIAFGYTWIF